MSEYTDKLLTLRRAAEELTRIINLTGRSRFGNGLNPQELNIAATLGLKKYGMKPLCEHFQVNNSTMTGIVDRLAKKGVILREVDSSDRRVVLVSLTKKWRRKYNELIKSRERSAQITCRAITEERIDELLKLLRETNDCISKRFGLVKKKDE